MLQLETKKSSTTFFAVGTEILVEKLCIVQRRLHCENKLRKRLHGFNTSIWRIRLPEEIACIRNLHKVHLVLYLIQFFVTGESRRRNAADERVCASLPTRLPFRYAHIIRMLEEALFRCAVTAFLLCPVFFSRQSLTKGQSRQKDFMAIPWTFNVDPDYYVKVHV
ncbi:hypothetical protein PUN28_006324 [Cardiocondyla obscurior]|uniref:Uncharacterized protein n=1 Tax=Cardiocondyla obscurior TaxID=286306 RepID=A0AAW2GDG7_9HYME